MRRQCEEALGRALEAGAEYADVRVVESSFEGVRTFRRAVVGIDRGRRIGLGVRVRIRGSWGFASGTDLGFSAVRQLAARAAQLAEGGSLLVTRPGGLAPVRPIEAEWHTPVERDPFAVRAEERADLLLATEEALRAVPAVQAMAGLIGCSREIRTFASTEGSFIVQERVATGGGYRVLAETADGTAVRSYPASGHFATGGFEVIQALDLPGSAERIREEVTRLITARAAPGGTLDVILTGPALAVQLHDTLGHAFELEPVDLLGPPGVSGRSFLHPEGLGERRVASTEVTIWADPGLAGGLGSYAYDDEGVPAAPTRLVDAGLWASPLSNRESAALLGLSASNGSARAAGFNRAPLVRMSNLSLEPGRWRLDDLVASTERGLLVESPVWLETEAGRSRFRCRAELGWLIEGGRRREVVRAPVFQGETTSFWQSCDAVCGPEHHAVWSVSDCVRGTPRQVLGTGHGAAPARFRNVTLDPGWEG